MGTEENKEILAGNFPEEEDPHVDVILRSLSTLYSLTSIIIMLVGAVNR